MVNTTQFYKTKVALAVVLSLGLAACGDSEGDAGSTSSATSTSTTEATQNTVGNQTGLSGTVSGVVIDTNGNPVVGAAVYLGGAETTTDAGGVYTFSDVAVVNVKGVNNEGDQSNDDIGTPLVLTIAAEGHMGASVTVTPQAQVDNTGGQGDNQDGGNSNTTIQTYVDGFTAQANTAQLPAISKRVYGFLRDCATNAPLVGGTVAFDFQSITSGTDVAGGTANVNNAAGDYSVVTDADGMFDLMVPADSSLKFLVNGWLSTDTDVEDDPNIVAPNADIDSSDEQIDLFLGTVEVCAVGFEAEPYVPVAPFISSINDQIGTTTVGTLAPNVSNFGTSTTAAAEYAALTQGAVNDFVINFSEEMASTFDMSEARVKVIAPGATTSLTVSDATVALSVDGESATVTFVEDLAEGSKVDVWFPHWLATDANDAVFLIDNDKIAFDVVGLALTGSSKAVYTHAYFCTFSKPTDGASVVLGPQTFDADITEDGSSLDLAAYSTAFQDNYDAANNAITQLNDSDANSATRLTALAAARGVTVTIDQDYAVVPFDATGAASLVWTDEGIVVDPGTTTGYTIVGTGANTALHIDGASHNDVITATPVNGFGDVIASATMTTTVVDAIAPTTVLQESYNITDATGPRTGEDVVSGTTGNAAFGNGGEISLAGSVGTSVGNPIIHVQPRHLAGQVSGAAVRNSELDSLTSGMSARLSGTELTAFGSTAAALALSQSTIAGHEMPVYDATAIAAWAATSGTIGVAFNEDATVTAVAPVFDGSTTLGGYAALNNVAADVDGNVVAVDLVTFDTPDVVALSLDAGADLSFVGAVTDSRGNAATANAQVFVQDTFPPMMTAAVWDGDTLDLTFNEPVVIPAAGTSVTIIDPETTTNALTLTLSTTNATASGNTLSIALTGGQNTAMAPLFVDGSGGEFLYDAIGTATEEQHALIDWDNIADTTGNEWSEFNPTLSASNRGMESTPSSTDTRRWEVVAPRFLVVNAVGPFTYSVATAGYDDGGVGGDDDGAVTFTFTFTHPIDLNLGNAFSDAIDTADTIATPDPITNLSYSTANAAGTAVLNALFDMSFDGTDSGNAEDSFSTGVVSATVTNGSLAISSGNTTLTLTIGSDAESLIFGTSTFGFATTTTSAINGLQTSAGNFNYQNTN